MSGHLEVRKETVRTLALRHDDASSAIDALGRSLPDAVDGGIGGPALLSILGTLASDAGRLSAANAVVARTVRQALTSFDSTDGSDAAAFRSLGGPR